MTYPPSSDTIFWAPDCYDGGSAPSTIFQMQNKVFAGEIQQWEMRDGLYNCVCNCIYCINALTKKHDPRIIYCGKPRGACICGAIPYAPRWDFWVYQNLNSVNIIRFDSNEDFIQTFYDHSDVAIPDTPGGLQRAANLLMFCLLFDLELHIIAPGILDSGSQS